MSYPVQLLAVVRLQLHERCCSFVWTDTAECFHIEIASVPHVESESTMNVTGPSLQRLTSIISPKAPAPYARMLFVLHVRQCADEHAVVGKTPCRYKVVTTEAFSHVYDAAGVADETQRTILDLVCHILFPDKLHKVSIEGSCLQYAINS